MTSKKTTGILLVITALVFGCDKNDQNDSLGERSKIEESFYYLHHSYDSLITIYQIYSDSLPVELHTSYGQMQRMYQQMEISHQHLFDDFFRSDPKIKRKTGEITAHMRGHITGTWYVHMQKIHNNIATMHSDLGQHSMAEMHKRLAGAYRDKLEMLMALPSSNDPTINKYSILKNGEWDSEGCTSCHGSIIPQ